MENSLLRVNNITAAYGRIEALHGVSLEVKEGETVGVLGSVGAGKSTLLKCIAGLMPGRQGQIYYHDRDISGLPAHAIALQGVALVPERRRLFTSFTVEENLKIGAYRVLKKGGKDDFKSCLKLVFDLFPILEKRKGQLAATLSGGEQQMLAIGRAMVAKPDLLLLDEPTLGLAPLVVQEIGRVLLAISKEGVTIVIAEQNASFVLGIIKRGYVLEVGNVVIAGTPEQLMAHRDLEKAYFGRQLENQ